MDSYYQAYLLRFQRGPSSDHWRATLQNAQTGELLRFANERDMLRYLLRVLAVPLAGIDGNNTTGESMDGADPSSRQA